VSARAFGQDLVAITTGEVKSAGGIGIHGRNADGAMEIVTVSGT
jgi:hypothetical protein